MARFPQMWVNGHPYPDPIHIPTFTAILYTEFLLGSVVVANDTGELRTVGPTGWITYAGAFPGAPTVVVWGAFDPVTMQFTTVGAVQGVVIPDTALFGGAGTISIGALASLEIGGYASVVDAGFAVAGTAVPSVTTQLAVSGAIVNVAELIDAATGDHIETENGEEVFGLLQSITGSVDGDAVAANPNETLQISFVYRTLAAPATLALYTMDNNITCYFRLRLNWYLAAVPYEAFVTGSVGELEILTQVFHIPTFTGAVYTDYPLASVVVAEDTGEQRTVGPTSWVSPRDLRITTVSVASYLTTVDDDFLAVDRTLAGLCTVELATALLAIPGKTISVKDIGDADTFAISVVGESGETVEGDAVWPIEGSGEEYEFYHDNTNFFVK